jgi:alpha-beta hydrolase superfamily lysophospholipase
MFDLSLGGTSFMDELATQGFDVYTIDLPGYGKSSRAARQQSWPVSDT